MPRTSDFPILKVPGRAKPWRLDVPARYAETGKRERRFFATRREAQTEQRRIKKLREAHGSSVRNLPPSTIDEAANAVKLLQPTGATLTEAVRHYVKWWSQRQESTTFGEMWKREREGTAIAGLADRSREQIFYIGRKVLPALQDELLCDITTERLESVLGKVAPTESSRKACIRVVSKVFRRGVALGYCQINPMEAVERPRSQEFSPEVLSPTEAKRLLETCSSIDRELVPYFAIGIFAGIRPDEIKRLRWSDVELAENHIRILAQNSKTRTRRFVEVESNLAEWLLPFCHGEGLVAPETNFRKRGEAVRKTAQLFDRWQSDIMRHSYCSHWLAAFGDLNRLRKNVGHRSPDVLFRHYEKAVKPAEAERFWQIKPGAELSKIQSIA